MSIQGACQCYLGYLAGPINILSQARNDGAGPEAVSRFCTGEVGASVVVVPFPLGMVPRGVSTSRKGDFLAFTLFGKTGREIKYFIFLAIIFYESVLHTPYI